MRKFLVLLLGSMCGTVYAQQSSITIVRAPQQGPSFFVRQPDVDLLNEFNSFKKKLSAYYPLSNKVASGEYTLLYVEHNSMYAYENNVSRGNANEGPAPDFGVALFYGENYKVVTVQLPTNAVRSNSYYYVRKSPDYRMDSLHAQLNRKEREMRPRNGESSSSPRIMKLRAENDSIYNLISGFVQPEISGLSQFVQMNKPAPFLDSALNCRMLYFQETTSYEPYFGGNQPIDNGAGKSFCRRGGETEMSFGDWITSFRVQWHGEVKTWTNGDYIMVEVREHEASESTPMWKTRTYCFRKV